MCVFEGEIKVAGSFTDSPISLGVAAATVLFGVLATTAGHRPEEGGLTMRGRPVRGVFAGFLFGLFLAVTLVLAGVLKLNSVVVSALPVAGILYGLLMAAWAPFGKRSETTP